MCCLKKRFTPSLSTKKNKILDPPLIILMSHGSLSTDNGFDIVNLFAEFCINSYFNLYRVPRIIPSTLMNDNLKLNSLTLTNLGISLN